MRTSPKPKRRQHGKLVRDGVPAKIKKTGAKVSARRMRRNEFRKELLRKLGEESREVAKAAKKSGRAKCEAVAEELGDVLEVARAIALEFGIDWKQVKNARAGKMETLGGFSRRIFLEWTEEAA
jgi:predicted house-cleaning noncanonical NTP pyrophosphatase (MazG superfamily)